MFVEGVTSHDNIARKEYGMWNHRDIDGTKFSVDPQGHSEKCEKAFILAFWIFKIYLCVLSSLLSILQWIFIFCNSYSLCYKRKRKEHTYIKNLPGSNQQYYFLMDDLLSCKLDISFGKLSGNFFLCQNIFHPSIFILIVIFELH